ncbi:MAG: hypothetical protein KGZ37_09745 [Nitrosarchaeum sp.]|nr:hypothetical protein [Nitrosarchaeum sp.]
MKILDGVKSRRRNTFAITLEHSSFFHTLIMMFMITFIASNQVASLRLSGINTSVID